MKNLRKAAALLLMLAVVCSLAACGASKTEKISDFLAEKMPSEYASVTSGTVVTDAGDGSFNVEMTVDLPSEGDSDENMLDTISLESGYLIDTVFADPPSPLNFKINFLKDGADFAVIERAHGNPQSYRTYNGETDVFQFTM